MNDWMNNWLGREVEFMLLGQRVRGRVVEAMDTLCTGPHFIVAEFHDGPHQVKVGGHIQSFRRIAEVRLDLSDSYEIEKGKFALSTTQLETIANAAGIGRRED